MKNIFQKGLPTVNCQLSTYIFFLLLLLLSELSSGQSDPHHDSLENAIRQAEEGPHKADLMLESLKYEINSLGLHRDETYLDELFLIYRYSKKINYLKGVAETARKIGSSFSFRTDSARLYLNESMNIYNSLNDSLNIAIVFGSMARIEVLAGNHDLAIQYEKKHLDIIMSLNDPEALLDAYDEAAENYKSLGLFQEEKESYLKMIALQDSLKITSSNAFIKLARYYINHGNYREGIRYSLLADSAMGELEDYQVPEYHDRDFMQAKMKGEVARSYRLWGYYDSALVWHRRAVAGMEAAPLHAGVDIPNQWEGIGYIYIQKGIYDSARIYLEKSASRRYELKDFLGAGESYDGLGYLFWLLGDEAGSVKYYLDAIEMKSRGEQPIFGHYRWVTLLESQSVTYLQLGRVYASWGMQESAMQNLEMSVALCRKIGLRKGEAEVLIEFGKMKSAAGDLFGAERNLKDALLIFSEIDYKPGQADAISSLGDLFFAERDFDKSLDYYKQAEYILQQTQNPIMLTDAWTNIGLTLAAMGKNIPAEAYLQNALTQAKDYNLFRRNMSINKALADFYQRSGKETEALEYFSDYLVKRDSVNKQNTYYLLADLQSKHEADMRGRQIELLVKENQVKDLSLTRSNAMLLGAGGLVLLLILLSVNIFRTLSLKEAQREALMQQRLFRARLSPDFISYSLGNIKELVSASKSTEASDYITYFSRMMQQMLEGSRQKLVLFSKGISMLKNYFELMKLHQQGLFDYRILVDDTIDQDEIMIPSFLEEVIVPGYNIEHGKRSVIISFNGKGKTILVSVESRGFVAESAGLSKQEIKSLRMIQTRLSGMEKKFHVRLQFSISDLFDDEGFLVGKRLDFEVPAVFYL